MRIILLRSDQPHHLYLQQQLDANFNLVGVVIEPGVSQIRRLRTQSRYRDYFSACYHKMRRCLLGLDEYRRRQFILTDNPHHAKEEITRVVTWINDPEVVNLLRNTPHDAVIIIGTSILKQTVLEAASNLIINIHGGFLPYYRGNHCFFFPLYEQAFDRIGCTIHLVDPGVDTGNIIERVVPKLYQNDTAETLYCRAEKLTIHRLVAILQDHNSGKCIRSYPQPNVGKTYLTRDRTIYHDLRLWIRRVVNFGRIIPTKWSEPDKKEALKQLI